MQPTHRAVEIAHHIPGRLRIRLHRALLDQDTQQHVTALLRTLPYVQAVDFRPASGSLVIEYDASSHGEMDGHVRLLVAQPELFGLPADNTEPAAQHESTDARANEGLAEVQPPHEQPAMGDRSAVAYGLQRFFKQMDQELKRSTDNLVDLKTLLPLAVGTGSLLFMDRKQSSPLWVTLLLFAFNAFVTLHGSQAQPTAASPQPGTDR